MKSTSFFDNNQNDSSNGNHNSNTENQQNNHISNINTKKSTTNTNKLKQIKSNSNSTNDNSGEINEVVTPTEYITSCSSHLQNSQTITKSEPLLLNARRQQNLISFIKVHTQEKCNTQF